MFQNENYCIYRLDTNDEGYPTFQFIDHPRSSNRLGIPRTIEFTLKGADLINSCWECTSHTNRNGRINRRIELSDMYTKLDMDKAYIELEKLTGLFHKDGMSITKIARYDRNTYTGVYFYNKVFREAIISPPELMNSCGNPCCSNPFHHKKVDVMTAEEFFHCKYRASTLEEVRELMRNTDSRKITIEQVHDLLDRKFIKKEPNLTQICKDVGIRYQTAVKILKFQRYREFVWLFWAERGVYDADEYPQYGKPQLKPYRPKKEEPTKQEEVERLYDKLKKMYGL